MTNANLLARLRTRLDEASASYWTDTEAYQALTDGQNALAALAVETYLAMQEQTLKSKGTMVQVYSPLEDIQVPYMLQCLYSVASGTVPSATYSASLSGTVLALLWLIYNPAAASPLYPIKLRSLPFSHPSTFLEANPFLVETSTALNGYASYSQSPPASGSVGQVTINTAGTNYAVGDFLTLTAGNTNCILQVTSVNAGAVTGVSIVQGGTGYSVANTISTTTNSASGAGFKANVTVLGNVTITFESVSSSNSAAYQAGILSQPADITASVNPTLPDIALSPVIEYAFAVMLEKDQRNDEANSAMQRFGQLAQSLVHGEVSATQFVAEQ